MTPFDDTFRRMLIKYIPHIDDKKIDKHEDIFAYREKVIQSHTTMIPEKYVDDFLKYIRKLRTKPSKPWDKILDDIKEDALRPYRTSVEEDLEEKTKQAADIFLSYTSSYNAAHKLWAARRRFAMEQGSFLQIRPTLKGIKRYFASAFNYWIVSIQTLPVLWRKKIELHFKSFQC